MKILYHQNKKGNASFPQPIGLYFFSFKKSPHGTHNCKTYQKYRWSSTGLSHQMAQTNHIHYGVASCHQAPIKVSNDAPDGQQVFVCYLAFMAAITLSCVTLLRNQFLSGSWLSAKCSRFQSDLLIHAKLYGNMHLDFFHSAFYNIPFEHLVLHLNIFEHLHFKYSSNSH